MDSFVAVLLEPSYYNCKRDYINRNFIATHYISYVKDCIGQTIDGKTIIGTDSLKDIKFEKIIIAIPLSPILKLVIKLLLTLGVSAENIILLLDKPSYWKNENIHFVRNDINYRICTNGDIIGCIDDCNLLISSDNELYILKEIFAYQCYDFFMQKAKVTVLDIGMNIGIASIYFSKIKNIDKIYSFEPFPSTYSRAIENFELNNVVDKIIAHPYGLGDSNQDLELVYNEEMKGYMSTVRNNSPYTHDSKKISVKIMDVAEVFKSIIDENPENIFVIKIDCEGAEYSIFKRLNEIGLMGYVKFFIMEWHNFEGNNVIQLESILQQNNFIYYINGARNNVTGMLFAVNSSF